MIRLLFGRGLEEYERQLLQLLSSGGKGEGAADGGLFDAADGARAANGKAQNAQKLRSGLPGVLFGSVGRFERKLSALEQRLWENAKAQTQTFSYDEERMGRLVGEDVRPIMADARRDEGDADFTGQARADAAAHTGGSWVMPQRMTVAAESPDMEKISDFFRRDSRRYDGGFKRY